MAVHSLTGLGTLSTLFFVVHTVSPNYNYHQHVGGGILDGGLVRRSLVRSAVDRILKNAKLITPNLKTRVFQKAGGLLEAVQDFNSFRPDRFNNFGSYQMLISGKKTVILKLKEGRPCLEVRYYRQDEFGRGALIRTDIIEYTD